MSFTTTIVTFDPLLLVFQKMNPIDDSVSSKKSIDFEVLECCLEERKKTKQSKASLLLTLKPNTTEITKLQQLSVVSGYVYCILPITFCRKYISASSKIKL